MYLWKVIKNQPEMKTKEQIEEKIKRLEMKSENIMKMPKTETNARIVNTIHQGINLLYWVLEDDQFIDVEVIMHKRWMVRE